MAVFQAPQSMCFTGSDVAAAWDRWETAFNHYYLAAELDSKPAETQVAILLHCAGSCLLYTSPSPRDA